MKPRANRQTCSAAASTSMLKTRTSKISHTLEGGNCMGFQAARDLYEHMQFCSRENGMCMKCSIVTANTVFLWRKKEGIVLQCTSSKGHARSSFDLKAIMQLPVRSRVSLQKGGSSTTSQRSIGSGHGCHIEPLEWVRKAGRGRLLSCSDEVALQILFWKSRQEGGAT